MLRIVQMNITMNLNCEKYLWTSFNDTVVNKTLFIKKKTYFMNLKYTLELIWF